MKKVLILIDWTGCPRNMLLKLQLDDYFKENGWEIISLKKIKQCSLIILCNCTFTNAQQQRNLNIIKAAYKKVENSEYLPKIVVTGCLSPGFKTELFKIPTIIAIDKSKLNQLDLLINATKKFDNISLRNEVLSSERVPIVIESRKNRIILSFLVKAFKAFTFLKDNIDFFREDSFRQYDLGGGIWCIQTSEGCLGECSYCSIRFTKGRIKSRQIQDIVFEAKEGLNLGFKKISLIADDNGMYGQDIGTNLGELLRTLRNIDIDFGISIDSLGPNEFIKFYSDIKIACDKTSNIILCLQHVNHRILNSMNRNYDVELLRARLKDFISLYPSVIIDAHFIISYPGETNQEFNELISFIKWYQDLNPFNRIVFFTFSPQIGTPASKLANQVSLRIKKKRFLKMSKIQLRQEVKKRKQYVKMQKGYKKILVYGQLIIVLSLVFFERTFFWLKILTINKFGH